MPGSRPPPSADHAQAGVLSEAHQRALRQLPRKEYLLESREAVDLTLVDILLAYCYDHRTTEGEPSVESCWTVNKLASSLSWLEVGRGLGVAEGPA